MQLTHLVSLLVVLSTTTTTVTAAPSPKRHLVARTTGEINARHPFNPYHAAHRFAATAENKKRASNHGRDAKPEREEKRTVKKKRGACVVRSSSSSAILSATPSATDYYVAASSATPSSSASSSWVDPSSTFESVSQSESSSAAEASATGFNVQNAAVNTNYSASSSSATNTNEHHRHSSSSAAESSAASSSSVESSIPVPTSTSTPAPAWTSTSSSTAPATTSASSGSDWKTGGHATYYYQNGNAGACGSYHSDSDRIIAINGPGYWSNYESGGVSPYCGKWITIKATDGSGRSTQAMVADVCPTCTGSANSLDLSVAAFEDLGTLGQGQIDIEWSFNN
ncbi:hypothetical protein QFC21_004358 [Naganishia friedmannii]|uniref:Uncharacterized protein n=1 Tax=Naganishia friedmannii TaxID=89922 RepID=A0ACC2VH39_9TREE|nr:hypothetical protein QFC21_004358 [Naganishia friedmannii]